MDNLTDTGVEGARVGRYEIISKLAVGGMGEVFLARSVGAAGFQKHVVIKKILPHLVEQESIVEALVHEAKLMVRLDHPNIVQVLDLGMESGNYFMAMEFVHGYNLSSIIGYCAKNKRIIPATVCAHIVSEMLSGLEYIHELTDTDGSSMNIVHRDVSPQNVLVSREGRVKLADFGIAKVLHEAEGALTQSLKGKLKYMAPEALEEGRIDQRYDLFASGIVLFEALCRAHLYRGKSDAELMMRVREARVPPVARYHKDLPGGLAVATMKALSKDPEARFQTARAFADALRAGIAPVSQPEAAAELRELVTEIYNEPDFPVSKKKLPDLSTTKSGDVRPLLIQSQIEPPVEATGEGSAVEAQPMAAQPGRHVNPLIFLLTIGFIGISVAVGYLLYATQIRTRPAPPQKGQVIIVEQHNRTPAAQPKPQPEPKPAATKVATPDAAPPPVEAKKAPVRKVNKPRRPRPASKPAGPFNPSSGQRTFRKFNKALTRCFNQHTKSGDPEIRLRVYSAIRGNGTVAEVRLEPPAQTSTAMGKCVIKVVRKIRYPRHDKPSVTFVQPLRVRPVK